MRQQQADEMSARVGAALTPVIVDLVRDTLRKELRAGGEVDPWVPHPRWPCASRRAACKLARSGQLEGVRRVGKGRGAHYVVRQSVLDAWIEAHPVDNAGSEQEDDYEREMAQRGLVVARPAQKARR